MDKKVTSPILSRVRVRSQRGFTLLELLVTISVAAILLAIAVPSYRSIVQRNSMAAQVNDLVGALNYARSEAVSRGQRVYLCQSSDQAHCTDGNDWSDGWIVYSPDPTAAGVSPASDNIIRVESGTTGQVQISRSNGLPPHVSFNADGFALGSQGDFVFHTNSSVPDRTIEIEPSGVISSSIE